MMARRFRMAVVEGWGDGSVRTEIGAREGGLGQFRRSISVKPSRLPSKQTELVLSRESLGFSRVRMVRVEG